MSDHTYKQFDAEMEEIRSGVMAMGGLVETQLARAIASLRQPDLDQIDAVAADEQAINQMQVNIDQQCTQIIARRQPTAIDLRMVLTTVKIVNELDRIGDEIKKIAYKAQQMQRPEGLSTVRLHELISYMMEDPRTITPALEIVFIAKSIERIGDHAKNIVENVVHVVKGKDVRHATAEEIRAQLGQ